MKTVGGLRKLASGRRTRRLDRHIHRRRLQLDPAAHSVGEIRVIEPSGDKGDRLPANVGPDMG